MSINIYILRGKILKITLKTVTYNYKRMRKFSFFQEKCGENAFLKTFANVSPGILGEKCIDCPRSTKIMS